MRRDHLSVHRLIVQRIHVEWPGTKSAKGSIYNATAQEAYTWQQWYQELPANLQPIFTVEINGEGSVQAASELPRHQQSYAAKSIGLSSEPLDRVGIDESFLRHYVSNW